MCAREGLVDLIKIIVSQDQRRELEKQGGARGCTPLHVAATYNEQEAVKILLQAGANPNECIAFGESGIQWASFYKWEGVVQLRPLV